MRKTPSHKAKRGQVFRSLLICMLCMLLIWIISGMPSITPTGALRALEHSYFLEPGEILLTVYDKARAYPIVRGTDNTVRVGSIWKCKLVPFLYESYTATWETCDDLGGVAYFPGPSNGSIRNQNSYLIFKDNRIKYVDMSVTFELNNTMHHEKMQGVFLENGVFSLQTSDMLDRAQKKIYRDGWKETDELGLYWKKFESEKGLDAFEAYEISAFDESGILIDCWKSPPEV